MQKVYLVETCVFKLDYAASSAKVLKSPSTPLPGTNQF